MNRLAAVALFALSSSALAQDPTPKAPEAPPAPAPWYERVKLSGRGFLHYNVELNDTANGANNFGIDRAYLTGEFMPVDRLRFQLTLDAGDTRNGTGNAVYLPETKFAFVELKGVVMPDWFVRAGLIPLAWIGYDDDLWGFRVASQMPVDRWGYVTSADFGLAFGGNFPAGLGSFYADVVNGEGFKTAEAGKGKELQVRLTVTPLAGMGGIAKGVFVTVYASVGRYDDPGLAVRNKLRVIGQAGVQSEPFTLAAEYVFTQDPREKVRQRFTVTNTDLSTGNLLAIFGVLNVGALAPVAKGLELIGRVDLVDPDVTSTDNDVRLALGGVSYGWNKFLKTVAVYENVSYGSAVGGVGTNKPADHRVKLLADVKF